MSNLYIPPEIIDQIIKEVEVFNAQDLEQIFVTIPGSRVQNLKNLSLVSKDWSYAARRIIWRKINIRKVKNIKEFIQFFGERKQIQGWVKEFGFSSVQNDLFKDSDPLDSRLGPVILTEDFESLIKLFPSITSLCLISPRFNFFKSIRSSPIFLNLKHFKYISPSRIQDVTFKVTDLELLQQIILQSPNLDSLELCLEAFDTPYRPITRCPSLLSYKVYESESFNPQTVSELSLDIVPIASLTKLEQFTFENHSSPTLDNQVFKFIQLASATLKSIILNANTHERIYSYIQFSKLFKELKVLETLEMTFDATPVDFLQHLPSSVQILQVEINNTQLQHFIEYSRPSLHLTQIKLPSFLLIPFSLLPDSVKEITIPHTGSQSLDTIYETLLSGTDCKFKKLVIETLWFTTDDYDEEDLNFHRKRNKLCRQFKRRGVELYINDYHYV